MPALKLNGRRIQGSRRIARALDQLQPVPPLFPSDVALRRRVEEAERWGEQELQDLPRLILRWGLVHNLELRRWLAEQSNMPLAGVAAHVSAPTARYYARAVGADEAAARRAVARLPEMLDHADSLLADGTLMAEPPNAAALQVLSSVRSLDVFDDLHERLAGRAATAAARTLFPAFPGPIPSFIPPSWFDGA